MTLVFNDWCGAQLLVAEGWDARVGRLVLASCETDDNYPPGLPGRAARLAGGLAAVLKPLRFKALRRLPMTFGLMSKRPIPDELVDQWLEPTLTDAAIRGDLRKYAGDTRQGRRQLVNANSRLSGFGKPVLVVWAAEDKVMPIQADRRLAVAFPDSRFVEIPDSRTLIPLTSHEPWLAPSPPSSATTEPMKVRHASMSRQDDQCGLQRGLASPDGQPVRRPREEPAPCVPTAT